MPWEMLGMQVIKLDEYLDNFLKILLQQIRWLAQIRMELLSMGVLSTMDSTEKLLHYQSMFTIRR